MGLESRIDLKKGLGELEVATEDSVGIGGETVFEGGTLDQLVETPLEERGGREGVCISRKVAIEWSLG